MTPIPITLTLTHDLSGTSEEYVRVSVYVGVDGWPRKTCLYLIPQSHTFVTSIRSSFLLFFASPLLVIFLTSRYLNMYTWIISVFCLCLLQSSRIETILSSRVFVCAKWLLFLKNWNRRHTQTAWVLTWKEFCFTDKQYDKLLWKSYFSYLYQFFFTICLKYNISSFDYSSIFRVLTNQTFALWLKVNAPTRKRHEFDIYVWTYHLGGEANTALMMLVSCMWRHFLRGQYPNNYVPYLTLCQIVYR